MPIYGPTGGDFALQSSRQIAEGLRGFGQGLTQRSIFKEQQRQFNFQNMYKQISDMVNSENYSGDWTKFFSKNENITKSFLATMYPGNPDMIDWVYEGLKKGNQSASQMFRQSLENDLATLASDANESAAMQQANKYLGDQGLPQAVPPQGTMTSFGKNLPEQRRNATSDLTPPSALQAAPQAPSPTQFNVPLDASSTETSPQNTYSLGTGTGYYNRQKEIEQQIYQQGLYTRNVFEQKRNIDSLYARAEEEGIAMRPFEEIMQSGPTSGYGDMAKNQGYEMPVSQGRGISLMEKRETDSNKYKRSIEALGTGAYKQAAERAVGFNEDDIEAAAKEYKENGTIRNENITTFMDKYGIEKTPIGIGQALTYMNAVMLDVPLPEASDTKYLLAPTKEAAGRYDYLTELINESSAQGQEGTAVPSPAVMGETILAESIKENFTDLPNGQAEAIDEYVSTGGNIEGRKKRLAENGISNLNRSIESTLKNPQVSEDLRALGRTAIEQTKRSNVSALTDAMINSMGGNSYEENRMLLLSSVMPAEVIAEKTRIEEARQFDKTVELTVEELDRLDARFNREYALANRKFDLELEQFDFYKQLSMSNLALEEKLGLLSYMARQGMNDAIDRMSITEQQKVAMETMSKGLNSFISDSLSKKDMDPVKFATEVLPAVVGEGGIFGDWFRINQEILGNLLNIPVQEVETKVPGLLDGILFKMFIGTPSVGETVTQPSLVWEDQGFGTSPQSGLELSTEEQEILKALGAITQ